MRQPLGWVEVDQGDTRRVIRVCGEVDLSNAEELGRELDGAIYGALHVVVDLSHVEYLDSQGLRLLHSLARRLNGNGVEISVVAPVDSIAGELLSLTKLGDQIPVLESLD